MDAIATLRRAQTEPAGTDQSRASAPVRLSGDQCTSDKLLTATDGALAAKFRARRKSHFSIFQRKPIVLLASLVLAAGSSLAFAQTDRNTSVATCPSGQVPVSELCCPWADLQPGGRCRVALLQLVEGPPPN